MRLADPVDREDTVLDTLCAVYAKAIYQRARNSGEGLDDYWSGYIDGLATAVAIVSGLPPGGISVEDAAESGAEIARARLQVIPPVMLDDGP